MSNPIAPAAKGMATAGAVTPNDARLRKTATQLEGLFVQRLFSAMRDTVDQDGLFSGGSAETTFTSLLDEKMSQQVPEQWNGEHSLAQALYNQLRKRVTTEELNAGAPPTDGAGAKPEEQILRSAQDDKQSGSFAPLRMTTTPNATPKP